VATLERTPHGQLEAVVLAAGELEATFVPAAGMIGCSLRHRGEELLVQRGGLGAWRGTGKSFGLPLLHPWANRLRDWRYAASGRAVEIDRTRGIVRADDHGLPIHGALAAAEDWDVVDAGADAGAARLAATLDYGRRDDRLAVFPFAHTLRLDLEVTAEGLTVTTALEAGDDAEVPVAFGWHPWLALPGVPRAEWELGLPTREGLPLDELGLPTGERTPCAAERAPLGDRVFDVHFAVAEDARFTLAGGGREIAVEWAGGYRYAQVFAPGTLDVVCCEPMMAQVAALSTGEGLDHAAPGERVVGRFRVRVT
jgi:galactose mutarotase-like enzyme